MQHRAITRQWTCAGFDGEGCDTVLTDETAATLRAAGAGSPPSEVFDRELDTGHETKQQQAGEEWQVPQWRPRDRKGGNLGIPIRGSGAGRCDAAASAYWRQAAQ